MTYIPLKKKFKLVKGSKGSGFFNVVCGLFIFLLVLVVSELAFFGGGWEVCFVWVFFLQQKSISWCYRKYFIYQGGEGEGQTDTQPPSKQRKILTNITYVLKAPLLSLKF